MTVLRLISAFATGRVINNPPRRSAAGLHRPHGKLGLFDDRSKMTSVVGLVVDRAVAVNGNVEFVSSLQVGVPVVHGISEWLVTGIHRQDRRV